MNSVTIEHLLQQIDRLDRGEDSSFDMKSWIRDTPCGATHCLYGGAALIAGQDAGTIMKGLPDNWDVGEDTKAWRSLFQMSHLTAKEVVTISRSIVSGRFNLRNTDLHGIDLRVADLSGANLNGADLSGANLRVADLRNADLSGANLSGANLRDADLRNADLSGANLDNADLTDADLTDADLYDADLTDADLSGANLSGADLGGVNLRVSDLCNT
jgi:hypothetical protein